MSQCTSTVAGKSQWEYFWNSNCKIAATKMVFLLLFCSLKAVRISVTFVEINKPSVILNVVVAFLVFCVIGSSVYPVMAHLFVSTVFSLLTC